MNGIFFLRLETKLLHKEHQNFKKIFAISRKIEQNLRRHYCLQVLKTIIIYHVKSHRCGCAFCGQKKELESTIVILPVWNKVREIHRNFQGVKQNGFKLGAVTKYSIALWNNASIQSCCDAKCDYFSFKIEHLSHRIFRFVLYDHPWNFWDLLIIHRYD